jgi:FkbM family methyltransferase
VKFVDGWYFPDGEAHLPGWMANPKVRMMLNGRPAYQGQKQEAVLALCEQRRNAVDVGGHVGLWSFNLAHWFKQVHAFEPVAAHRECFAKNVLASVSNVTLIGCALGDRDSMVSIRTEPTSSGDSRVDGAGDIPMRRLDSFGLTDVDLLKIDVEGFELFVLRGAEEILARNKPVVIVEQKPGHAQKFGLGERDAVPYLESMGYRVAREMAGDFICVPA